MTTVKATDNNNERAQPRRFEKKTNMASIYPAIVIGRGTGPGWEQTGPSEGRFSTLLESSAICTRASALL